MHHNHMFLDRYHLERESSLKNKVTAIIATSQAPLKSLMWSIFSLLCRSHHRCLEHIDVIINGPDNRTGDTSLQDKKQAFLEDLRSLEWNGRDMPLSIHRSWSRVGHTQAMESVIPWVHTEFYVIMHDDIIVLDRSWMDEFQSKMVENENVAILAAPPLLLGGVTINKHMGEKKLALPHMNTAFTICRKPAVENVGARWWGYHIKHKFDMTEWAQLQSFMDHHLERQNIQHDSSGEYFSCPFGYFNMDVGAWVYYLLDQSGYEFTNLEKDSIHHFKAVSWDQNPDNIESRFNRAQDKIDLLEKRLKSNEGLPGGYELYRKYL